MKDNYLTFDEKLKLLETRIQFLEEELYSKLSLDGSVSVKEILEELELVGREYLKLCKSCVDLQLAIGELTEVRNMLRG